MTKYHDAYSKKPFTPADGRYLIATMLEARGEMRLDDIAGALEDNFALDRPMVKAAVDVMHGMRDRIGGQLTTTVGLYQSGRTRRAVYKLSDKGVVWLDAEHNRRIAAAAQQAKTPSAKAVAAKVKAQPPAPLPAINWQPVRKDKPAVTAQTHPHLYGGSNG